MEFLIFIFGFLYLLWRINNLEGILKRGSHAITPEAIPPAKAPMPEFIRPPVTEPSWSQPSQMEANKPTASSQDEKDFEFAVGSKAFTAVGIVAVTLGVAFFLRYAFDQNLISESMRVVLGLIGGLTLIATGWFANEKYPSYGQALTGGGIGILYASLYAAYNFYHLAPQPYMFACMIAVTALGVALALLYNSLPLAGFSFLGGFLTPFLLSSSINNPHALFAYIALLNLGVFGIAFFKKWPQLTLGAFIGTLLTYLSWQALYYTPAFLNISLLYTSIFFIEFLAATIASHLTHKEDFDHIDIMLAVANPLIFFSIDYANMGALYGDSRASLSFLLGVLYSFLGILMKRFGKRTSAIPFSEVLLGVSFIFFIITIPIYFERGWIATSWAAESVIMLALGTIFRLRLSLFFGIGALLLAGMHLFIYEAALQATEPWTNSRFISFMSVGLLAALGAVVSWLGKEAPETQTLPEEEKTELKAAFSFAVAFSYMILLSGIMLEIWKFHPSYWIPIAGSIGALAAGIVGIHFNEKVLRALSFATLLFAALSIISSATFAQMHTPVFNSRAETTLILIAVLAILAMYLGKYKERLEPEESATISPAILLAINGLLFWLLSIEIIDYFNQRIAKARGLIMTDAYYWLTPQQDNAATISLLNMKRAALSIAWTVYAIAQLILGIVCASARLRQLSIALFAIVVLKVFLFDTANLNDLYRFVSFISLGIILLLSGYLYYRNKDKIRHFIEAA